MPGRGHVVKHRIQSEKPTRSGLRTRAATTPPASRPNPDREERTVGHKPDRRSSVRQLVAEVERLHDELAAARTRMAELEARAETDPLLDIRNRRSFERELERSLAYVKRYGTSASLVFLDLDHFKAVNDRHGHAAGDAILRAVAAALLRQVRASDVVARLGGDEFGILLWNLEPQDAAAKATALETAVAATSVAYGSEMLSVGASAGVAALGPLDRVEDALIMADRAMYARKARRNRIPS